MKDRAEFAAVNAAGIPFESSRCGLPNIPRDMADVIFEGISISLFRIAPMMLGDELFEAAFRDRCGRGSCKSEELAPRAVELPFVLGCFGRPIGVDAVPHRKADVIFLVS